MSLLPSVQAGKMTMAARASTRGGHLTNGYLGLSSMADDDVAGLPASWKEAKAAGTLFYWTGKLCKAGHIDKRYARNGACVTCERARNERIQRDHPERSRARAAKHRALHPDVRARERLYANQWYHANKEIAAARHAAWMAKNYAHVREYARALNAKQPEKARERAKRWNAQNPDKKRALAENRRARLVGAEGAHTGAELMALFDRQKGRCVYCRSKMGKRFCADHIVALVNGGSNWISNIQLTCRPCNSRKHAKDPFVFARQLGRLL